MGVDIGIDGMSEDTTVVGSDGGICVLDDGIACVVNADGCGGVYCCIDDDIDVGGIDGASSGTCAIVGK